MGNTNLATARKRISARVKLSEALLARMGITPEAYERVLLNALISRPDIGNCDVDTLDQAIMKATVSGLIPDGENAALVPFKGKVTLLPMIAGRLTLARRATPGIAIRARCVYADDEYEYAEGLNPVLVHIPAKEGSRDPEDIIAAYSISRAPGSIASEWEWLWRDELDRYKARSPAVKAGRHSPWVTDPGEMYEKVVLGLLLKRLPKRVDDPPMPAGINYMDAETGEVIDSTATEVAGDDTSGATAPPADTAPPAAEPAKQTTRRRQRRAAQPATQTPANPQTPAGGGSPFGDTAPQQQQQEQRPAGGAEAEPQDLF